MENVLAILLTGGEEHQLHPLTRNSPKAGIPFGGAYRIIDFAIANCVNSDLNRILILTQGHSASLDRYIRDSWNILSPELGEYIEPVAPAKMTVEGTASAVYQNVRAITAEAPDLVLLAPSDHIYKMNYGAMVDWHRSHTADVTVATVPLMPDSAESRIFVTVGGDARVSSFERPSNLAAMGIYLFSTQILLRELESDAASPTSGHDLSRDLLPAALQRSRVIGYDFVDLNRKAAPYWRDVATLDAWYEANMDLAGVNPQLNLYDPQWPVRARVAQQPPAKFVFADAGARMGTATDSLVAPGTIISGGRVSDSVLSAGTRINSYSEVDRSILLPGAQIGRYARVRNTIVCPDVEIPAHTEVGYSAQQDQARGWLITPAGITVVT